MWEFITTVGELIVRVFLVGVNQTVADRFQGNAKSLSKGVNADIDRIADVTLSEGTLRLIKGLQGKD